MDLRSLVIATVLSSAIKTAEDTEQHDDSQYVTICEKKLVS